MKKLREKVPPDSWRTFELIGGLIAVPALIVSAYFEFWPVLIPGAVLALALIVGHYIFWRCPWCGRLLPTDPYARHMSTCPYCSEHL